MKKIVVCIFFLSVPILSLCAQAFYELSFTFPNAKDSIAYKAFFNDLNNGKGKLRLKFTLPSATGGLLVDMEVIEDDPGPNPGCVNSDRLYYKLVNTKYKNSTDPGVALPKYICFQKDPGSGLFEPAGVTNSSAACKADIVKFSKMVLIEPAKLKEFVAAYFKPDDELYMNIIAPPKSKGLTIPAYSVKLYLLFVANVTDPIIGTANRKDMKDVISFFSKVKLALGINQFIYDTITGAGFNKQTVESKINNLMPGPLDIVVFYYAGHGFRTPKDNRPGPYIALITDDKQDYKVNALKLEYITEMIRKKPARLNLVISDCCNRDPSQTQSVDVPAMIPKKGGVGNYWSDQNLRQLFLSSGPVSTTLMITAAEPDQLAISNPEFGGYFSNFFLNALDYQLTTSKSIKWADIIKQAADNTEYKASHTWCNTAKTQKCNPQRPLVMPPQF